VGGTEDRRFVEKTFREKKYFLLKERWSGGDSRWRARTALTTKLRI